MQTTGSLFKSNWLNIVNYLTTKIIKHYIVCYCYRGQKLVMASLQWHRMIAVTCCLMFPGLLRIRGATLYRRGICPTNFQVIAN